MPPRRLQPTPDDPIVLVTVRCPESLRTAFEAAVRTQDQLASQVLRAFMSGYVARVQAAKQAEMRSWTDTLQDRKAARLGRRAQKAQAAHAATQEVAEAK
jgi:hypothetical protein